MGSLEILATFKQYTWPKSSCWEKEAGRAGQCLMDLSRPEVSGKASTTRNQSSSRKDQNPDRGPRCMAAGKIEIVKQREGEGEMDEIKNMKKQNEVR